MCPKYFSTGAPPADPAGEGTLQRFPRPIAGFRGRFAAGIERRGQEKKGRGEEKGEGNVRERKHVTGCAPNF